MSGRHHSKAVKLGATVLARLAGEQAASETFGIDRRTIRGWVRNEDVPTDSWAALDDLAGAQLLERVARGEVRNPTTLATVRGIASRNRRYAELIAQRKGRRSGETCDCVLPPGWVPELHPKAGTPEHASAVWAIAAANMTESRGHFMRAVRPLIAYYIDHKTGMGESLHDIPEAREATAAALEGLPNDKADPVGALQQWIENLDDETLAARQALVDAAFNAYREAIQGELQRRAYVDPGAVTEALDPDNQRQLRDWALDKLDELKDVPEEAEGTGVPEPAARSDPEPPEPAPTPIRRAPARPAPVPIVFDGTDADHDRGWVPLERRDF